MFICTKNDIANFPFHEFNETQDIEKTAKDFRLPDFNSWMMPQLMALFGGFKLFKDEEGKYDPIPILKHNIGTDPHMLGIWKVCTKLKRSSIIKTQISPLMSRYSALVPLIMAGIKEYQKVNYSEYSRTGLQHLMGDNLFEAATCTPPALTKERMLEIREVGLTVKSGPNAGEVKKAISTWSLTGVQSTELNGMPKLAMTMLSQVWVADPSIRSEYMILDPSDWDVMPEPLVHVEVLKYPKDVKPVVKNDIPW